MHCSELDNLLYPYLDGELVETDRLQVDAHLSRCDGCRKSFDREHSMMLLIRTRAKQAGIEAPAALRDRIGVALAVQARKYRMRRAAQLTAAAAGLALCTVAAHQ